MQKSTYVSTSLRVSSPTKVNWVYLHAVQSWMTKSAFSTSVLTMIANHVIVVLALFVNTKHCLQLK